MQCIKFNVIPQPESDQFCLYVFEIIIQTSTSRLQYKYLFAFMQFSDVLHTDY